MGKNNLDKQHKILNDILRFLNKDQCLPYQAAAIAYKIFTLIRINKNRDDYKVLLNKFKSKLHHWQIENLLENQIDYALKLVKLEEVLEYEEIHKLFSLLDEIYALRYLGFSYNEKQYEKLEFSLEKRIFVDKDKIRLVVEDRFEDWKKKIWWYNKS